MNPYTDKIQEAVKFRDAYANFIEQLPASIYNPRHEEHQAELYRRDAEITRLMLLEDEYHKAEKLASAQIRYDARHLCPIDIEIQKINGVYDITPKPDMPEIDFEEVEEFPF